MRLLAGSAAVTSPSGCPSLAAPVDGPGLLGAAVAALEHSGSVRIRGTTADGDPFDVHVTAGAAVGTVGTGAAHDAPHRAATGRAPARRGGYVVVPVPNRPVDLPSSLSDVVDHFLPAPDQVVDGVGRSEVDGAPVLVLTTTDGRALSVTAEAPHLPVRLVLPEDDGATGHERVLRFACPAAAQAGCAPGDPVRQEETGC